ncbi:DeoR family transcriptional regulator [Candidatus Symbiothrix dinenymphae]|uniref:DeoR family transcriptional regulator n=1 Tax=Candidatus Symbiothrix dinenymphae TaxID=467085 RepID=UPI001D03DD65
MLYVKENGEITTSAYAKLYAVAERTARKDLNELSDKQILKRVGETNLAKYILN